MENAIVTKYGPTAYQVMVTSNDGPVVALTCRSRTAANELAAVINGNVIDVAIVDPMDA